MSCQHVKHMQGIHLDIFEIETKPRMVNITAASFDKKFCDDISPL